MKISAVLLTAILSALAETRISARDSTIITGLLNKIFNSMANADNHLLAFRGGPPTALHEAAKELYKTIVESTPISREMDPLNDQDVQAIGPASHQLTEAGTKFLNDLIAAVPVFEQAGLCEHMFEYSIYLGQVSDDFFITTKGKFPADHQAEAQKEITGTEQLFSKVQSALAPGSCNNKRQHNLPDAGKNQNEPWKKPCPSGQAPGGGERGGSHGGSAHATGITSAAWHVPTGWHSPLGPHGGQGGHGGAPGGGDGRHGPPTPVYHAGAAAFGFSSVRYLHVTFVGKLAYSPSSCVGNGNVTLRQKLTFHISPGTGSEDATARTHVPPAETVTQTVSISNYHMKGEQPPSVCGELVIDRLSRIEALLEQQSRSIDQLNSQPSHSPYPASLSDELSRFLPLDFNTALETTQFLIPQNHSNVSTTLLSMTQVRDIIGAYPRDYFMRIEERLPLPRLLDDFQDGPLILPNLDPECLDALADDYFQYAHPHHPLFTRKMLGEWQAELLEHQDSRSIRTAICLSVYALGHISTCHSEDTKRPETLGLEYFQPAFKIITKTVFLGFQANIEWCQALLLAASYLGCLGRPLRQRYHADDEFSNIEIRTFWQCFMAEWYCILLAPDIQKHSLMVSSDGIATADRCRSGIEPFADRMPLPQSLESADDQNHVYSIAEHAIRRLLNRINCTLYSPDDAYRFATPPLDLNYTWHGLSIQKLLSLSAELNRQLEEWYSSIPEYLRFEKGSSTLTNDRCWILRIRYYNAKQLIYGPFLLWKVSRNQEEETAPPQSPMPGLEALVMERCETCVASCVTYLRNAADMMGKRTPYLWTMSQNCLSCIVMLWLASTCATLQHLVPDLQPIQEMVCGKLQVWAVEGSSFEAELRILEQFVFSDPA
ncbi:hypothetical protein GGR57DRAFT_496972 [Xylariaceae sp. FL1272]|nr:hypothetical protein GGR57DRAFT_496972 [Xylariaceae sp. FL1272]